MLSSSFHKGGNDSSIYYFTENTLLQLKAQRGLKFRPPLLKRWFLLLGKKLPAGVDSGSVKVLAPSIDANNTANTTD